MAFPTVGAMVNVTPLAWLDLFAEVSGIPFGDLGHVLDAEAGVRFIPVRFFAKLTLTGPFIGASFRF